MKNSFNTKIIVIVLALAILCAAFAGCNFANDIPDVVYAQNNSSQTVTIHTARQSKYLTASPTLANTYANGKKEYSKPKSIILQWDAVNINENSNYTVILSENSDMSKAIAYSSPTNSVNIINLKIATTYFWQIQNGDYNSEIYQFDVSGDAPRNISVDGVTNVRDLGGWQTTDGKRVKQGLIYRCGRLNESSANSPIIEITNDGIKTMRDFLSIKSEIDLRENINGEIGGITSSPLGEGVNYYNLPMEWDGNIFLDNRQEILNIFSLFADENNYPLIFHCNIGTDRTGMISFLINALLGVSEDDLIKDYLFSNLGNIGGTRKKSGITDSPYYKIIQNSQGDDLQEKTFNALIDFGIPKWQLDKIISLLSQ
ncbi:MAG: tyrosine-protein phosphatase [Clostridia bacterium]|nr:tyrosine-protein phosphatase [Clostridia bacterium]